MRQMSLFDGTQPFIIDKPIRLIELFSGYGSQALALKYLGVPFEHWKISEWAYKSIQAYKDLHFAHDTTDYSKGLTIDEVTDYLYACSISANYNTPLTRNQIAHYSENVRRTIYNNIKATHNLGSICNIKAEDLEITQTDSFLYIMTYSFPCQDLSNAGKGLGMGKGTGTRSGLLWEVERILSEIATGGGYGLPQVLLMENVPAVLGANAIQDFSVWLSRLEELGYKNYYQVLNLKDFNIPQNRERCFMVSILGDYYFTFPKENKLDYRLKDFLDAKVDESYYLSDSVIESLIAHKERHQAAGHGFGWKPTTGGGWLSQLKPKADTDQTVTFTLKNQATEVGKITEVANTLMARDYKGFGNQEMNAVMEIPPPEIEADGALLRTSEAYAKPPLEGLSRAITTQGKNGVIEWKK